MAIPAGYRPLPGSERPQIAGSVLIGPVEATERVAVTLLLRQKPGSPELPDLQHWQDTPPAKRAFLSPDEFYRRHGASEADVDAVLDYLQGKGLRVIDKHAGRRRIVAEGSAAEVNAAFAIKLNRYRAPGRFMPRDVHGEGGRPFGAHVHVDEHVHRGFDGPVHLPAKLIEVVAAVIGLDNRHLGLPAGNGTGDPPGAGYLSPAAIAQRYNFPTNKATGQTIGLFEGADAGAAYLSSDITSFIQALPGGATLPLPSLTDILLLGNINNPINVTSPATPSIAAAVFECTIDVSIAAAAGLGANINVYFSDDNEAGWVAFLDRAIFPPAGDNPPSVLSASWVPYLSDDPGTVGSLSSSSSPVSILTGYLQSAAARGITVLMAIGDWGSNNLFGGVGCHVSYPNADPWVTACGGTILGGSNPVPPPPWREWTWSDANLASPFNSGPPPPIYNSTGGGVSDTFPLPPYQSAAGILPISKNDGGVRRGVPDVSGMVAMSGFFIAGTGSKAGYGTSAVAPLYAGLVATINAFLGRDVGFLNPTLYIHGQDICNDITVGDNDPGNTPDSPFYTAAIDWDPCTGWGSINGLRLLAALAPAPILATAIADSGTFADTCLDSFVDETLTIDNAGFSTLLIWNITSSLGDFQVPGVASYPLAVSPGGSIDVVIRFKPIAAGFRSATLTIFSNDLFNPHTITVTGSGVVPRLVLGIADSGNFGNVCLGSFADEPLVVNNGGKCTLLVTAITASSGEFLLPSILAYPVAVAAGASVSLPIRFQPTALGATPAGAVITVSSNDPRGPQSIVISGNAPGGKLAVTGSAFFGGVPACCREERVISVCNVGDCKLNVSSVAFKRKSRHWKLINNPFPAPLHPGSCLTVVIRYKATEKFPHSCDLVITSDDPATPVRTLEVVATTVWNECGCKKCCDDCRKGCCEKRHCDPCGCRKCHDDRDDERDDEDGGDC
ncbi:MAG: choice-of-anchor D domain-containing protein [Acetobacteraceae bacterium]